MSLERDTTNEPSPPPPGSDWRQHLQQAVVGIVALAGVIQAGQVVIDVIKSIWS